MRTTNDVDAAPTNASAKTHQDTADM